MRAFELGVAAILVVALAACTTGDSVSPERPAGMAGMSNGSAGSDAPAVPGDSAAPSGDAAVSTKPDEPAVTEALAVGPFSTCIIDQQQTVSCFGRCGPTGGGGNRNGAPPNLKATAVAVGRSFACALLIEPVDGSTVRCWGGPPADATPKAVDVVEIAAAEGHACARTAAGSVVCWGETTQPPSGLVAKTIAASGAMDCAVAGDDAVQCWGASVALPPADLRAKKVALNSQLTDPAGGPRYGCAIGISDDVRCWGDNPNGVQSVPSGLKAKAIAAARGFACAIDLSDTIVCWGTQPGFGTPVPTNATAKQLSMTFRTAGAVLADGTFSFWGDLRDGRGAPPQGAHAP
jgi:hypothetical protein